jgi:hypothetical protein
MYTTPIWDGLRKVYSAKTTTLDAAKVGTFSLELKKHLGSKTVDEVQSAILNGPIHMDQQITNGDYRGTFVNRVQSFLWKNHGLKFEDKSNILNDALTKATKCSITSDLYAQWDKSFNWTPGDFGDGKSCFWQGHAGARYFLKDWEKAIALTLYSKHEDPPKSIKEIPYSKALICQSGDWYKGYGRCWVLIDWPVEGCIVVYNSYPSEQHLAAYVSSIIEGIRQTDVELANSLVVKEVKFTNGGQYQNWFYTNSGKATVICTPKASSKIGKDIDLKKPQAPELTSYKEYGGTCVTGCGKYAWTDRPSLVDSKGRLKLAVCEQCVATHREPYFKVCACCGEWTFYMDSQKYNCLDKTGKRVSFKHNGNSQIVCSDCHNQLDTNKFDPDPLYQSEPKTVKFVSAANSLFYEVEV